MLSRVFIGLLAAGIGACGAPTSEDASSAAPATAQTERAITFTYSPPGCTMGSFGCGGREGPVPPDIAGACTDERWIGFQLGPVGQCPAARFTWRGRWRRRRLFPSHPSMQPDLQRFCVYEWRPRAGYNGPPVTGALPDSPAMRLERDCDAVAPLFTPGASAGLFEQSLTQQMNVGDFPSGTTFPTPRRARVAVVDSAPTEIASGNPSPGSDGHGFVVGALARDVSCLYSAGAQGECAARILSYQGLRLGDGAGTAYGRPSEVARAMYRALTDWIDSGRVDPLIINLSLGWDGRYGGRHGPDIRMTALAGWLVSQWAACEDALIIAAAGNRSQVNSSVGPMFPAGWEQDGRLCPSAAGPAVYAPIVHAIGGVDGRDDSLRMVRPNGDPRLIAPSAFLTADAPIGGGMTMQGRLLSGTSLSAAVTSGAAAQVWAMDPTLLPEQVMEEIWRGGVTTARDADFANGIAPWTQGRVDVCGAVQRVCPAGFCPAMCTPRGLNTDSRPDFDQAMDLEYPGLRAGPVTTATITQFPIVPSVPEILVNPYAGPQPGGSGCPLCGFDGGFLVGQLELGPDEMLLDVFIRPTPCSPGWCDEELGGFKIDLGNPEDPFKIDMSGELDTNLIETALIEVTTETDGETVVRASELFIY